VAADVILNIPSEYA